jgi:Subtilase family
MRSKILSILMTAALGSTTLSSHAAPVPGTAPPPAGYDLANRSEDPGKTTPSPNCTGSKCAETPWRRIGLLRKGIDRCPEVRGWSAKSLLELARNNGEAECNARSIELTLADLTLLHKLKLDRFCVYTKSEPTDFLAFSEKTASDFPQKLPQGLAKAEPDRMVLSSNAPEKTIQEALANQFLSQAGWFSDIPFSDRPRVRLVFIDSQPTGEGVPDGPPDGSQHGYTLGYLSRRLTCPREPCAVQIAFRRALHHDSFNPGKLHNEKIGGRLGEVNELATAIVAEVLQWRAAAKETRPKHLILNISLGWDGEMFDGEMFSDKFDAKTLSKLKLSTQTVYHALRFARHSGALVIAAAGNRRGGEQSKWPVLPAAWELKRPSWVPFFFGPKLVYAIGGVESQDWPLPNSRDGGRPLRVAYGDHAATGVSSNPRAVYTGTSVSAAVASSIAAVVWHLRPELTPKQVMKLLTRSGKRLETQADFYFWKPFPAPHQKRLSLCTAVVEALREGGATRHPGFGTISSCTPPDKRPSIPPITGSPTPISFARTSPPPTCNPMAQLWTWTPGSANSLTPCPMDQFLDMATLPVVGPQPPDNPCPGCTLVPQQATRPEISRFLLITNSTRTRTESKNYILGGDFGEWLPSTSRISLAQRAVEGAVLEVDCYKRGKWRVMKTRRTFAVPCPMLVGTQPLSLDWNALGDLTDCTAVLNFKVKGQELSVQSPVYLGNPQTQQTSVTVDAADAGDGKAVEGEPVSQAHPGQSGGAN